MAILNSFCASLCMLLYFVIDWYCYIRLAACREKLAQDLEVDVNSLELSMGMSNDFENAIARGSTSVRVGSTIFGARNYAK
jgi:PLP dependent protein